MCSRRPAQVRGRSSSRGIRGRPEALISLEDKRTSADCMIFFKSIKKINLLTHRAFIAKFCPLITINHSWSLGLCPNKSLEAFESPVRPLHPGDRPSFSTQSNCVHRQDKLGLPFADSASQHRSTFSPSLPSRSSLNSSFSFTNREISRRNYLISRVCTTFAVNQFFFSEAVSSPLPLF